MHARAASAVRAMRERFHALIEQHRCEPRDNFTTQLIVNGAQLSDDELTHTLMLVLFAGHETTSNLIASALAHLARDSTLYQQLRRDRAALPGAIEEFLRLDSPVEMLLRIALQDVEIGAQTIRAGERLYLVLNSANRDPEAFERADELQLASARRRHLAFGPGVHMCMGAPLARLVARLALDGMLERFSAIELLVDDGDPALTWREELMVRGPRALQVQLLPSG